MNEPDILPRLRQRDPDAFSTMFDMYSDKVYRLALGVLDDEYEAECVVQDAFMRLFERLDQFDGRSQLGTWLYRIAYNLTIDRLRQRRPHISVVEADDETVPLPQLLTDWQTWPENLLAAENLTNVLEQAISALPEKYRVVFLLREIEEMTVEETAEITNLTPANVKVRLHRARLFLRERLTEQLEASLL